MSKMLRLELVGLVLLACTQILTEHRDFHNFQNQYGHQSRHYDSYEDQKMTREVRVTQGRLRGFVVQSRRHQNLQPVDVFLGIPYAAPPLASLRFTPPQSPRPWSGVRHSNSFAPVCPQVLPDLHMEVTPGRYEYLKRLLPYLRNQSEDCLYLNIYAPHQSEGQRGLRRFPVMVFIHGESFEWNSGNPYDGSMLASYGDVVFVTINFRLGILGFLRPGTSDNTSSNFGLLDQVAALLWLKENIAVFGGDPNSVTLVGHGTGAIFANLLLISPVASRGAGLFKRGILMSGSALSANAIGKAPLQVTKQVAHALNCPTGSDKDLANCLQNRPLDSLLDVRIDKPPHVPAYAPLTDGAVVPKNPWDLMKSTEIFGRYDLMYGVTESEKFHELPPVALLHGLLDHERDKFLRDHVKATHELEPEMVLSKLLEHYGGYSSTFTNEFALKNREIVLQALSDSGTVAPLLLTGKMHARVNPKSYMYVFSHPRAMQDYYGQQHQHTVHGEELAYILGIPVGGGKYHLQDRYNIGEALFSEAMMTWWCNFAHTGNPNAPRRSTFLTDGPKEWLQYELDWPEYDPENQTYFNLTIPPEVGSRYREAEMKFWNEDLPELIRRPIVEPTLVQATHKPLRNRPAILDIADGITEYPGQSRPGMEYGFAETHREGEMMIGSTGTMTKDGSKLHHGVVLPDGVALDSTVDVGDVSTTPESSTIKNSSALSLVIGFGVVFLLINLMAFFYLYHKRHNLKTKEKSLKRRLSQKDDGSKRSKMDKQTAEKNLELGNKHDSRPDLNEVLKNDKAYDNNSNFGRRSKLSRQNSTSTIDTHIKVREWIQQEIVHRCSPRFLRKTRETLQKEHQDKLSKQQEEERRKLQLEKLMSRKEEPIYEENPTIVVRPGKKLKTSRVPKVSVAIDATPATRTESVLNQIPIELAQGEKEPFANRSDGVQSETPDSSSILTTPQVVIIEHHHSKSDPIPMISAIYKHPKISESESGSVNSLYARANPKLKSRLPRIGSPQSSEELTTATSSSKNTGSDNLYDQVSPEDIYGQTTAPKFTTFGSQTKGDDINVTCREPTEERDSISPEEALKTIKRRKYPKVLPDIEKRRSLPVPNSLFIPKQHGNSLKDHKNNSQPNSPVGQILPPLPPPRVFGTSKSLDLAEEESSSQQEAEPITTNLHVGPLLKRQDSTARNNSDPNLLETLKRKESHGTDNAKMNQSQSSGNISANILGSAKGDSSQLSAPSLNEAASSAAGSVRGPVRIVGNPNWYRSKDSLSASRPHKIPAGSNVAGPDVSIGNPNWYKPLVTAACSRSDGDISPTVITIPPVSETQTAITTRETNAGKPFTFLGDGNLKQNSANSVNSGETLTNPYQQQQNWEPKGPAEPKIVITPRVGNLLGQSGQSLSHNLSNIAGGSGRKLIDEGHKASVSPMANFQSLAAQDFNPSAAFPVSEQRTIAVVPKDEVREPKIIITPNNSGNVVANLKQPKIIIKPSTNPQKSIRENKNIPKVSAIPSPECQNLRNTEQQQTSHQDKKIIDLVKDQTAAAAVPTTEKPLLKEKPNVTRIPSFSKRNKNDQPFKLEKSWSPAYPEKAEIVQKVDAVPINKVTEVPLTPTMDRKTGIPMFAKKNSEKSSSTDSSNSTTNSNTGTIKKQPK
ncbi:uncharacterized protein LOC105694000 isoform X2 [Athalia rosae]|uniref:uncharacterized protein LOC105694000 isoform X2 n=1 Tax=Athalia rosae TaxID=37344 RepID=UPI002033801B|nr:uncharacterized protein LOC105694000 isoform X2 [Athalia rosae]